ncbi:hypothetical protein D3C76_1639390 [compost metagenome]
MIDAHSMNMEMTSCLLIILFPPTKMILNSFGTFLISDIGNAINMEAVVPTRMMVKAA